MSEEKVAFCKKVINLEEQTVTWTFGNGAVRSISLDDLNEATQTHAALHGLSQKGGDSYASAGGDYAFAVAALDTTLGNLRAGVFNNVRTGDGQPKGVGELGRRAGPGRRHFDGRSHRSARERRRGDGQGHPHQRRGEGGHRRHPGGEGPREGSRGDRCLGRQHPGRHAEGSRGLSPLRPQNETEKALYAGRILRSVLPASSGISPEPNPASERAFLSSGEFGKTKKYRLTTFDYHGTIIMGMASANS